MKPCSWKISSTLAVLAVSFPSLALAHPGHDGDHGGLTWDFSATVLHYLSSPSHVLPIAAAGVLAVWTWRHFRAERKDTKR